MLRIYNMLYIFKDRPISLLMLNQAWALFRFGLQDM